MIPVDLTAAYELVRKGKVRDDRELLHASDLTACHRATWLRLRGAPELPMPDSSLDKFVIGHAIEQYIASFLSLQASTVNLILTHGRRIVTGVHPHIVGHIDFDLTDLDGHILAVIDATTTSWKSAEAKWSHKLKTAFYARSVGAPHFAEWIFVLGHGGVITEARAFWFKTADFADELVQLETELRDVAASRVMPPAIPPDNLGYNPCGKPGSGKSYCQAYCEKNAALTVQDIRDSMGY